MFQVNPLPKRIHLENQALFSSKVKSKKLKCHLLQFLFGALRVKVFSVWHFPTNFYATPGAKIIGILSKEATLPFIVWLLFIIVGQLLTLRAPFTTASDDIHK